MRQYHDLLRLVKETGEPHKDRTGIGTMSVFGAQLILDMREGYPLITTKAVPLRWIATELMWMLAGSTDEKELASRGVNTWAAWATKEKCQEKGRQEGDLGPTYGWLIRNFGGQYMPTNERRLWAKLNPEKLNGHDQLWELCVNMDTDPYSRRHIISMWDPVSAWELTVPPCQPLIQVRLHEPDEISLRVDVRSQDAFIGLPFDMAHYGLLLEMLAYCTSRRARNLVMQFGDLHIYSSHAMKVTQLLDREPRLLPTLKIEKPMWHATPGAPGQDTFVNLLQIGWEHLVLEGYDPWPKLGGAVAV
jgi:thymidylate synthase